MKFNKKIIAGIAAGIVLVGIVLCIKFIPQKTKDVNDADGRGTKQSEVQKDKDKENKTTQKDKNNDKTEDKTKSKDKENKAEAKDKEESATQAQETQTQAKNNNNQTTKQTQPATTAPATTKHTHNYSIKGETVAPTYDADGYTVYKCSCGATTKGDWVQKLQKPTGYTEADAIRFRNEIEAYAVEKGYQINRSLNADNSQWSQQWGIFDGNYDSRMAQAKSEIDGPAFSQGSWHTYINVIYYQVKDGMWAVLPYTL